MVNTPEKKQTIDVGTQIVASEKADAKDLAAATPEQQKKMEEPILDPSYLTEINKIKSDPQDIDPVQKENLAKLIEKKDYVGAIKEGFRLIGVLFKGGKGGPGLEQFTSIDEKLYKTRDEKTLTKHIEYLQKEIEGISGIKRKLHLTRVMSDLKNCVSKLKNPEADQYDIILQNIHPGQILLLNKKADTSKGATLLREYEEDNIADFTHSVLVTENENHELMIIHSTEHKESEKGSGVEEIPLKAYLKKHTPADMLALNQQSPMDEKSQEFARARIGKAYDSGVAITEALGKEGTKSLGFDKEMGDVENNDRYNCVELIAQSYQNDEKIKHVAQPNEFLSLFTPSYMAQTGVKTS